MGERCGGEGITSAGLVDLGDRPAPADQPAHGAPLPVRRGHVGVRRPAGPDGFEPFADYARQRLVDDPHLWASALHDELVELGYGGSYPSLTRALRARKLRPHCEPCAHGEGPRRRRSSRTRRVRRPSSTGWSCRIRPRAGGGARPRICWSGRWRTPRGGAAVLAPAEDQPHLIEALDAVVRRLGGLTHRWRFDRMATVCHPDSGRLTATFGPVAAHYAVGIAICPRASGQPQGRGGEGEPDRRAALVAHPGRRAVPGAGAGQSGPVLRPGRRRPAPAPRRTGRAPRWPSWPPRRACGRCRPGPSRPC